MTEGIIRDIIFECVYKKIVNNLEIIKEVIYETLRFIEANYDKCIHLDNMKQVQIVSIHYNAVSYLEHNLIKIFSLHYSLFPMIASFTTYVSLDIEHLARLIEGSMYNSKTNSRI